MPLSWRSHKVRFDSSCLGQSTLYMGDIGLSVQRLSFVCYTLGTNMRRRKWHLFLQDTLRVHLEALVGLSSR
ncbi:MAG: hypothetical protein UX29_C0011G0010 [Parcubacteria group bacterium GW2011_GWA2_46_10]|nr:MAG: hypothetical protein UW86_C0012G0013 [Microgenomates group bacterium GW2011_GWA1_Microgenomates_45_10]KKU19051.1 MAG: hypothetical protein UX29_C0011G0010 [Parcubacteria group bacterium GW2011_GWA2_46_10]